MSDAFESRLDVGYDGEIPPSVDEAALRRMETVAYALDKSIRIPETDASIGLDAILGIVPVAGDLLSAGISGYIVAESANLGVSYATLLRMVVNISIDVVGGSIPYVGTFFDSVWKANKRNVECALEELAEPVTQNSNHTDRVKKAVDIPVQTD
jgi:hypothetical protein